MRITTQMMMSQYKKNVNDAFSSMNKAMQTAYDYRSFDLPSDNPLAAAQTFQVHWETSLNEDYQTNVSNLKSSVNTAESILQNIDSILTSANGTSGLAGITGTTSQSGREAIANEILKYRDTILSEMNSKYSDSYLFGGSNSSDVPFTVSNDQLYYRGINVDTGENSNGASETLTYNYTDPVTSKTTAKTMQVNFGSGIGAKLNGYTLSISTSNTGTAGTASISTAVDTAAKTITINVADTTDHSITKGNLQDYFQNSSSDFLTKLQGVDSSITSAMTSKVTISGLPDNSSDAVQTASADATASPSGITDIVNLDSLANESVYVDIGLGITQNANGSVSDQSAFNSALSGISYLGYGTTSVTANGITTSNVPNNVYSLLTKIASDLNNSSLSGTSLTAAIDPYMTNLTNSQDKLEAKQTQVGSKLQLLSDTATYLQNIGTSLDDRDNDVEYIDVTDAITNYYMQQYCYEASLKVGSETLPQSLMDYLK